MLGNLVTRIANINPLIRVDYRENTERMRAI